MGVICSFPTLNHLVFSNSLIAVLFCRKRISKCFICTKYFPISQLLNLFNGFISWTLSEFSVMFLLYCNSIYKKFPYSLSIFFYVTLEVVRWNFLILTSVIYWMWQKVLDLCLSFPNYFPARPLVCTPEVLKPSV